MKNWQNQLSALVLVILSGCQPVKQKQLSVIDFYSVANMATEKGKPNLTDTFAIKVIDTGNVRVIKIPFHNQRTAHILLPNGNYKEGATTFDTTYVYCILQRDKKVSLRYDSLDAVTFQKFAVDSLLNRINLGVEQLNGNAYAEGKLTTALKDKRSGALSLEKFVTNKNGTIDSTYRYYDNRLQDVDFSIAPKVDQEKKSKLVKVVNINLTNTGQRNEFVTYFKIGHLEDSIRVVKLMKRFQKDNKRLN